MRKNKIKILLVLTLAIVVTSACGYEKIKKTKVIFSGVDSTFVIIKSFISKIFDIKSLLGIGDLLCVILW